MGIDASIYFMMRGGTILRSGEAENVKQRGMPCLKDVLSKAVKSGVKLRICEQSCALLGFKREDLVEPAEVVGAATLNDHTWDADAVLCF